MAREGQERAVAGRRRAIVDDAPAPGRARRFAILAAFVLVFSGFGAIVLYAYGAMQGREDEPPLIRAETRPAKRPPDDPGVEIPNENAPIVAVLGDRERAPTPDRILPTPEAPPRSLDEALPELEATEEMPDQPPATPPEEPQAQRTAAVERLEPGGGLGPAQPERTSPQALPIPQPLPEPASGQPAPVVAATQPDPVSAPPPEPQPPPRQVAVATPPAAASTTAADAWRVQLLAVADPAGIEAAWQKLRERHPDVLGPLKFKVEEIDRGTGRMYRLQATGFGQRDAAIDACEALKRAGTDCFVTAGAAR